MDFLQLAREQRYSVRKFTADKVEKEKLDLILAAGRVAPTAVNYQPQRILVLDSAENRLKLKECTRFHFEAPLALLICYDRKTCWKHKTLGETGGYVDASVVTAHMMLEAANLGLGSTWVGSFDYDKARELFELPDFLVPVAILPLGYPAPDAQPSPMHGQRLAAGETVFYNSFAGITPGAPH